MKRVAPPALKIDRIESWSISDRHFVAEYNFIAGGRRASIRIGHDGVTFSGDLPVDDAARAFFTLTGGHMMVEHNKRGH